MATALLTSYKATIAGFVRRGSTPVVPIEDRDTTFIHRVTKPGPTNTGYSAELAQGPIVVDTTTTTFSTTTARTIRDTIFTRKITFTGQCSNLTFINCWFQGTDGSSETVAAYGLTGIGNFGINKFIDCTFAQLRSQFPQGYVGTAGGKIGFRGHHVLLKRCKSQYVVDGFRPRLNSGSFAGNNVQFTAEDCYSDNLLFLSPDTGQSNRQSHNDIVQDDNVNGQIGVVWDGCNLRGFLDPGLGQASFPPSYQAGHDGDEAYRTGGNLQYPLLTCNNTFQLATTNAAGTRSVMSIMYCWLDGGSYIVNAGGVTQLGLTFINNKIGRGMRLGDQAVLNLPNSTVLDAFFGNVYEDDGTPANFRHNG